MKAKGCRGVPIDTAAPRLRVLSLSVTLRMGICIRINVCEAHGPCEESDAADGVARQNLRTTSKTHRVSEICWNIASSVQQTKTI